MLLLYLALLIFGGIFLMVSIFFGQHGDGEFGVEGHADVAAEFHEAPSGGGVVEAVKFLSLRNAIFFSAFFGLTGSLLTWLRIYSLLTFASAVGLGLFAAMLSHKLMAYLKKTEVGQLHSLNELEGSKGRVLIEITRTNRGKISIVTGDRTLQVLALVADESSTEEFRIGEIVTIVRIENGIACVAEADFVDE